MLRKLMILGIVVFSLVLTSTFTVSAADEKETLDDTIGDVTDVELVEHPEIKDIDISKIVYTKTGSNAAIEIYLEEDLEKTSGVSIEMYVTLATSEQEYGIYLFDNDVFGSTADDLIDVTFSGYGDNILSFTFELIDSDEDYVEMIVYLAKTIGDVEAYADTVPNIPNELLTVDAGGPYTGKVGQSIKFSGTVEGGEGSYTWEWHFDDDFEPDATGKTPSYTFTEEGTYDVFVFVEDSAGSTGYAETTVVISGTANGGSSSDDSSGSSGMIIFIILIVVIVAVAAVAVIYIKKR